jgi:hypothetical protein
MSERERWLERAFHVDIPLMDVQSDATCSEYLYFGLESLVFCALGCRKEAVTCGDAPRPTPVSIACASCFLDTP